jgi:hypothetical protein
MLALFAVVLSLGGRFRGPSRRSYREVIGSFCPSGFFTSPRSPWAFSVAGGLYFVSMFVTQNRFGFSPLLYPQLFPTLRYRTSSGHLFGSYLKYVPMDRNFNPFNVEYREIAAGLNWTMPLKVRWTEYLRWGLSLDFSDMRFALTPTILSNTTTLSLSGVVSY